MPEDIAEIDKNFKVSSNIDKDDIKFYNIDEKPFKIYGIHREGERYCRMTENVAKDISEGVYALHCNTAGGRVRFITDSGYVAIHAEMDGLGKMPHFAFCGSIGFDLYVGNDYKKTFIPPISTTSRIVTASIADMINFFCNCFTISQHPRSLQEYSQHCAWLGFQYPHR